MRICSLLSPKENQKRAASFEARGTNQGLLAPNNPNEVEKSPESGGVPAHRRYSDFGDFSICGAAADFRCILSRVPLGCWLRLAAVALFESHWTERKNPPLQKQQRIFWWGAQWDSNPRSPDPQSGALTDYAMGTTSMRPKGLEPPAHCLEGSCSIHLSYGRTLLSHWVLIWFAAVSRSTLREV